MAINKLVPISNAFTQLAEEVGSDILRMKPVLMRWAKQADTRIGSVYSSETNYYLLDVVNLKAKLPDSAIRLQDMIIGDVLDNCPGVFDNLPTYSETEGTYLGDQIIWQWSDLESFYNMYSLNWTIQNNYIVFQTPFNSTEITVKLLTYPVDAEGMPLVPEGHIEAISCFLQAKVAMKERFNKYKRGRLSNMDLSYVELLKKEYVNQKRLAVANDDNFSENQERESSEILNQPYSGSSNLY